MRVAEDHDSDAGGVWMHIQILADMKHVDQFSIEINGLSCRQFTAGALMVHVAANRRERCDVPQSIENGVVADVTGMQDAGATGECVDGFWTQQPMSVGDDANPHASSLRQH